VGAGVREGGGEAAVEAGEVRGRRGTNRAAGVFGGDSAEGRGVPLVLHGGRGGGEAARGGADGAGDGGVVRAGVAGVERGRAGGEGGTEARRRDREDRRQADRARRRAGRTPGDHAAQVDLAEARGERDAVCDVGEGSAREGREADDGGAAVAAVDGEAFL